MRGCWAALICIEIGLFARPVRAQIDPENRRLIQIGYNQSVEGQGPIAAYGFFYYNKPGFLNTNLTLRLTAAPIYVDGELGFKSLLGENTDFAVGLAGGGFADSYSEVRQGHLRKGESFNGHGGEASASVYHLFNPGRLVPLYGIVRGSVHASFFASDTDTDKSFVIPDDFMTFHLRTGIRFGGKEPSVNAPVAMELSLWYDGQYRNDSSFYGFANERHVQPQSHLFWGRALCRYTTETLGQMLDASVTSGVSVRPDRFTAYRLGGVLPFASEFPLNIPGYYFQELSAERFALLNTQYSIPITPNGSWNLTLAAAGGYVDYLPGMEQSGNWHSGVGGGISFTSPSGAWFISLIYGHGFGSIRDGERGSNQAGLVLQYDFDAKKKDGPRRFVPAVSPYRSRGGERLLH